MAKKLYVKSFDCPINEYNSNKIVDVLKAADRLKQTDLQEADIILFNTCSVREKAQEKLFPDLGRAKLLKAARPDLLIGVSGCVASQEGAAIVQRAVCGFGIWPTNAASLASACPETPQWTNG
jgi:tRNA-2-methylthio-N6-dimethylallyladenosine synthase